MVFRSASHCLRICTKNCKCFSWVFKQKRLFANLLVLILSCFKLVIVKNSTCFPTLYLFSTSLFFKHCCCLFAVVFYLLQHTVLVVVVVVVVVVFSQNSPSTSCQNIFFPCWCLFSPCLNCSLVSFALAVQLQWQPRLFPVFSVWFCVLFCSVLFCSWFSSVQYGLVQSVLVSFSHSLSFSHSIFWNSWAQHSRHIFLSSASAVRQFHSFTHSLIHLPTTDHY